MGKRVFITGHTGFKGSWLSLWLQHMGAIVTGYSLAPNTSPSIHKLVGLDESMPSTIGDIRDADELTTALLKSKSEIVIHMAAQPLVRYSYENPVDTYTTNVMGLVHLFEAVRKDEHVRVVINVTSDKCYENREWVWGYREEEPMGGYDPYSSSKGCAEIITSAYRRSFFNPELHQDHGVSVASGRAGNVIGGGDWSPDRLIPDIMRSILSKEPVGIRNPQAVRPWQHVLDPLNGYLILAEKLFLDGSKYAEGWNFGPDTDDARPVEWIADQLIKKWGDGAVWKPDGIPGPHEAHYLKLDCSKAHDRLGWKPKWNIDNALDQLCAWHKALLNGKEMRKYTISQIENYSTI